MGNRRFWTRAAGIWTVLFLVSLALVTGLAECRRAVAAEPDRSRTTGGPNAQT